MKRFLSEGSLTDSESLINKMIHEPISNSKQPLEKRGFLIELTTTMDGAPAKQI